ncbi:MAG: hypothetical protein AAGG07_10695 [Planctomycetota bacterium]
MGLGRLRSVNNLLNPVGAPPVGIDFGVGSLKVLQLNTGDAPSLIAAAALETPENLIADHPRRLEFQLEALPKLIREGGFKGKRGVCALPAPQTQCKHLQIARAPGVSLSSLVEAALPDAPGFEPGRAMVRHIEVGEPEQQGKASSKTEVICLAAPRDLVATLMQGLKAAKLEPVGMHSEFQALLAGFEKQVADPTLVLDLGLATTKVLIAAGGKALFARTIEMGGRHLDETLAAQLRITASQAKRERLSMQNVVVEGGSECARDVAEGAAPAAMKVARPKADLSEPLEILLDEIRMCLRYHRSLFPNAPVNRVLFTGGESRHRAMCEHMARAIGMQSSCADAMAQVSRTGQEPARGVDLMRTQPGWAVPLGLCLSKTDL